MRLVVTDCSVARGRERLDYDVTGRITIFETSCVVPEAFLAVRAQGNGIVISGHFINPIRSSKGARVKAAKARGY